MPLYGFLITDHGEKLIARSERACADDKDALRKARAMLRGAAATRVVVVNGKRHIAILGARATHLAADAPSSGRRRPSATR